MRCAAVYLLLFGLAFDSWAQAEQQTPSSETQIRGWIADLQSDDLPRRWHAAYALGQSGPAAAGAVEPLTAILENLGGHEYVRGTAAWALGRIGPAAGQAAPLLIETLESKHVSVRRNAPLALAAIGPPAASPAVPQLLALLNDPDAEVRVNAAVALWRIGRHERALPALSAALRNSGPGAYEAAVALGRLEAAPEPAILGPLVGAFGHGNASVRQAAARSAGKMGEAALPALQTALEAAQHQVRETAAEALGWMGPAASGALVAALNNDAPTVRRIAARALGRLGTDASEAEPALVAALDDAHPEVRKAVASAIRKIRGEP